MLLHSLNYELPILYPFLCFLLLIVTKSAIFVTILFPWSDVIFTKFFIPITRKCPKIMDFFTNCLHFFMIVIVDMQRLVKFGTENK